MQNNKTKVAQLCSKPPPPHPSPPGALTDRNPLNLSILLDRTLHCSQSFVSRPLHSTPLHSLFGTTKTITKRLVFFKLLAPLSHPRIKQAYPSWRTEKTASVFSLNCSFLSPFPSTTPPPPHRTYPTGYPLPPPPDPRASKSFLSFCLFFDPLFLLGLITPPPPFPQRIVCHVRSNQNQTKTQQKKTRTKANPTKKDCVVHLFITVYFFCLCWFSPFFFPLSFFPQTKKINTCVWCVFSSPSHKQKKFQPAPLPSRHTTPPLPHTHCHCHYHHPFSTPLPSQLSVFPSLFLTITAMTLQSSVVGIHRTHAHAHTLCLTLTLPRTLSPFLARFLYNRPPPPHTHTHTHTHPPPPGFLSLSLTTRPGRYRKERGG